MVFRFRVNGGHGTETEGCNGSCGLLTESHITVVNIN